MLAQVGAVSAKGRIASQADICVGDNSATTGAEADMRSIAFVTDAAPVERILNRLGEPSGLPRMALVRAIPGVTCSHRSRTGTP
jgi:hypothetical protein